MTDKPQAEVTAKPANGSQDGEQEEEINPVPNLLMLKLLVVGLGVMLVVAALTFVVLMVTVGPKSVREARAAEKAAAEQALVLQEEQAEAQSLAHETGSSLPAEISIDLPDNAVITGTAMKGDSLILTIYGDKGQEIIIVDLKSGDVKTRVVIE